MMRSFGIVNGLPRHVLLISVRLDGDAAKLGVAVDGVPEITYPFEKDSLDVPSEWALPSPGHPGLATMGTDTAVFGAAMLRMVSGKATWAEPAAAKPPEKPDRRLDKNFIAPKDSWVDVSKRPALGRNVSVAVQSVKLGKFIQGSDHTRRDAMKLALHVANIGKEPLTCQWAALMQSRPNAMLVNTLDEPTPYGLQGVTYHSGGTINPQASADADLIFETPVATAKYKYLHLTLPGAIFNEPNPFKLEIPAGMIQPDLQLPHPSSFILHSSGSPTDRR